MIEWEKHPTGADRLDGQGEPGPSGRSSLLKQLKSTRLSLLKASTPATITAKYIFAQCKEVLSMGIMFSHSVT